MVIPGVLDEIRALQYLDGRHLVIALAHLPPWAIRHPAQLTNDSAAVPDDSLPEPSYWKGGCIDLLRIFQYRANFTFTIKHEPEERLGMLMDDKTTPHTWSGILGMMLNGTSDFLLQGLQSSDERRRDFLFAQEAFMQDPYIIHYQTPKTFSKSRNNTAIDWWQIARPFRYDTWMVFALVFLAVVLLSSAMEAIIDDAKGVHKSFHHARLYRVVLYSFEEAMRHLTSRGAELRCSSASAQVLIITWALFCVVLMSLYPAQLFTILQQPPKVKKAFTDFASMKAAGYKLTTRANASYSSILRKAYYESLANDGDLHSTVLEPIDTWPQSYDDVARHLKTTRENNQNNNNNKDLVALFSSSRDSRIRELDVCNSLKTIIVQGNALHEQQYAELSRHFASTAEVKMVFRQNDTSLRDAFDYLVRWARASGFLVHIERNNERWKREQDVQIRYSETHLPECQARMRSTHGETTAPATTTLSPDGGDGDVPKVAAPASASAGAAAVVDPDRSSFDLDQTASLLAFVVLCFALGCVVCVAERMVFNFIQQWQERQRKKNSMQKPPPRAPPNVLIAWK